MNCDVLFLLLSSFQFQFLPIKRPQAALSLRKFDLGFVQCYTIGQESFNRFVLLFYAIDLVHSVPWAFKDGVCY